MLFPTLVMIYIYLRHHYEKEFSSTINGTSMKMFLKVHFAVFLLILTSRNANPAEVDNATC